jgi:hypothetical protein
MNIEHYSLFNVDGFVKSIKSAFTVIPAKAEIQYIQIVLDACLRRACPCAGRGMTEFRTFCEFVKVGRSMLNACSPLLTLVP